MKLPIKPLSQRDPRWSRKKLGESEVLIGGYGCLLTCHSMMLQLLNIEQTPDILNETYKNNGVYHNGNLIHFWSIPNVFPQIKADEYLNFYDKPTPMERIYDYLDRGLPVIVKVDFDVSTSKIEDHFVIIHGYNDEVETKDLLCIDPWTGEEYFFHSKFGDPVRYIFGWRLYSWEVEHELTDEEKLIQLEKTIKDLEEQIKEQGQTIGYLESELDKESAVIDRQDDEIRQERNQRHTIAKEKTGLEKEVAVLNQKIEKYKDRLESKDGIISQLRIDLESSVASQIRRLGFWKVLKICFTKGGD